MIDPVEINVNIRDNVWKFFIEEVILKTPTMSGGWEQESCILILDDVTKKVVDSFMSMVDSVDARIIGFENLK